MLGLKRFRSALITITGIELMHRIKKAQFKLGKLRIKGKTVPDSGMQFSPHDPTHASERSIVLSLKFAPCSIQ
jgi:hypothetical protein